MKIAVVGSGIAGAGAAWSIHRSGNIPVLYEKKPKLGGNAKVMTWDVNGQKVNTGLAVLAWPHEYFHNYNALIKELGIKTTEHDLKYMIMSKQDESSSKDSAKVIFAHGKQDFQPEPWLKEDLEKWDKCVSFIRKVNSFFFPSEFPSLYRIHFMNPLKLFPLRILACRVFGCSQKFWDLIFVPIHTSTFLEVDMDYIPAFLGDILEGIVPLNRLPQLRSWETTGADVIYEMVKDFPPGSIRTSCEVVKVEFRPRVPGSSNSRDANGKEFVHDVLVYDEDNNVEIFDAVIFACSAPAIHRSLHSETNQFNGLDTGVSYSSLGRKILGKIEKQILQWTGYTTDRDKLFPTGIVHSDSYAVVPRDLRDYVMNESCNLMIVPENNPKNLENHFILSSWAPTMQSPELKGKRDMIVSYGGSNADKVEAQWTVTNREAHPILSIWTLAQSALAWPLLQGSRNGQCFFCASGITPGNGHDLSLVSGLVVAEQLGCPFPFPNDTKARIDFDRLRYFLLRYSSAAPKPKQSKL